MADDMEIDTTVLAGYAGGSFDANREQPRINHCPSQGPHSLSWRRQAQNIVALQECMYAYMTAHVCMMYDGIQRATQVFIYVERCPQRTGQGDC